eukprot:278205-Rhodomonas_salina.1
MSRPNGDEGVSETVGCASVCCATNDMPQRQCSDCDCPLPPPTPTPTLLPPCDRPVILCSSTKNPSLLSMQKYKDRSELFITSSITLVCARLALRALSPFHPRVGSQIWSECAGAGSDDQWKIAIHSTSRRVSSTPQIRLAFASESAPTQEPPLHRNLP